MTSAVAAPRRRSMVQLVALAVAVVLTTAATNAGAGGEAQAPAPARAYVVMLHDTVPGGELDAAAALLPGRTAAVTGVFDAAVHGFIATLTSDEAARLGADPRVEAVEQDAPVRSAGRAHPDDTSLDALPEAPDATTATDRSIPVYVVGDALRSEHPDLAGRTGSGYDATASGVTDLPCATDRATALGRIVGGHHGIADRATVVGVRVLSCDGTGTLSSVLRGLDWIARQPRTSPGVVVSDYVGAPSTIVERATASLATADLLVVAAAGDDDQDACDAAAAGTATAITVAAIDARGRRAPWSNFGSCVDLFAPGVGLPLDDHEPDTVSPMSGTDLAAAIVAGAAARHLQLEPDATAANAGAAILEHATRETVADAGPGSPDLRLSLAFLARDADTGTAPGGVAPSTTAPSTVPDAGNPASDAPASGSVGTFAVPAGTGVSVFAKGSDGAMWWRQATSAGWSAWQSFGGSITSVPTGAQGLNGWVYVFARGADGALWWQGYDGTSWTGWKSVGGSLVADPVAASDGSGVWVFVRGTDNAMYWGRIGASGWSGWQAAGGSLGSNPAVAVGPGGPYVFVTGSFGGVWANRFAPSGPGGWESLGGAPSLELAAAADSSGVSVYARGSVNALYRSRSTGGAFSAWDSLGGNITSSPVAVGAGSNSQVFARGLDGALYVQNVAGGSPQGWFSLGGAATSDAAATLDATGTTVFVRGNDGQLWAGRSEGPWPGWSSIGGVPIVSDPFALATAEIKAAPPGPPSGWGFDACQAPSTAAMQTWRLASPFTSAGIYIGGANRACPNTVLNTPAWVNAAVAQGWRLIPIYVGLQAPCISFSSTQFSRDPPTALGQGAQAADDAVARAVAAGLPAGVPIYFDMEGYNSGDAGCVTAVRAFVNGWVARLHTRGYQAAMYSSLCSGIVDQARVYDTPGFNRLDAIWLAAWEYSDGNDPRYATYQPNLFGFTGCGAPLTDSMWPFHQRIRQYRSGHTETYGGVSITIDSNIVDGPLAP